MNRPSLPSVDPAVVLDLITEDGAPVLRNLFELYAHDFSEYVPLELNATGRFDAPIDREWWTDHDRHAYFVRDGGKLVGFALVRKGSRVSDDGDVMDVAEFFVVRGARRKGIGVKAAHALFAAFPGAWEMRVRRANVPARAFWTRAAAAWNDSSVTITAFVSKGVDWEVIRLGSPQG
jgi:predicted acetyltransferase